MGMGFQFEQHRLGLWDLSWDLKKTICWEMGIGPPLHDPLSQFTGNKIGISRFTKTNWHFLTRTYVTYVI